MSTYSWPKRRPFRCRGSEVTANLTEKLGTSDYRACLAGVANQDDSVKYAFMQAAGSCYSIWEEAFPVTDEDPESREPLDLSGADFSGALFVGRCKSRPLCGADFTGANLTNSCWDNQNLDKANFTGASLRNSFLLNSTLRGSVFRNADLRGSVFWSSHGSKETPVDFSDADLSHANFVDPLCKYMRSDGATMQGLQLYATGHAGPPPEWLTVGLTNAQRAQVTRVTSTSAELQLLVSPVVHQLPSTQEGGSKCFIVTAACVSELAEEVVLLRRFRDEVLSPTRLGRFVVRVYERASPPVAQMISTSKAGKAIVRRIVVRPAYSVAKRILQRRQEVG